MPAPRGKKPISYKRIGEKIVKPIRYVGKFGDYMAGELNGNIIEDSQGKPVPYSLIIGD